MIDSTVLFQEAISRDSRSFHARFLTAGSQVVDGDIRSVTIRKGSCGASEFIPGAVFCSYIEATIDNCSMALEGREVVLQIGVMTNSDLSNPSYEYIRIGSFRVGKPSTNTNRSVFTAQGKIAASLNVPFTVPQTLTLASVAAQITALTTIVIRFASGINTAASIGGSLEKLSCREALSVVAAVAGGYATETADGDIIVNPFTTAVTASYAEDVMTEPPAFADYDMEITGVKVIAKDAGYDEEGEETEEVSYTSGDPVNIEISNPYMTSQAFPFFADNVVGLRYRPGTVHLALGDPRLEPWDTLKITDTAGRERIVPCMDINISYDGGVQVLVEAPGLQDDTQSEGSLAKALRIAEAAGNAATNARKAADQAELDARAAAEAASDAQDSADSAAEAAGRAQSSADSAGRAAAAADAKAVAANTAAANAQTSADEAKTSATQANIHANSALTQLSVVEDVVNVLGWISEHATYKSSTDTEVVAGKYYFARSGSGTDADPYVYSVVASPAGSPAAQGYYELDSIDEAVSNYISTHLALDSAGLWVIKDGQGYKILLANDGLKVYDAAGNLVSTFGESITFSSLRSQYIGGENAYIIFNAQDGTINIGGNKVTVGGSRTLSQMLADIDAAVTDVEVQYASGTSPSQAPDSGWSASSPTWEAGKYIWQRTATTKNGVTTYSNVACIQGATGSDGEDATVLRIDSSRGVLFKSNYFSTVLTVTIQKGSLTITDAAAMRAEYGAGAYLQWYWRKFDDSDWRTMLVSDSHITDDGFSLTITPDDVDEKIVFKCDLIV